LVEVKRPVASSVLLLPEQRTKLIVINRSKSQPLTMPSEMVVAIPATQQLSTSQPDPEAHQLSCHQV